MDTFHLLRPWWLLVLVPWLALCWRLWRRGTGRNPWLGVCDERLMPFILEGVVPRRRQLGGLLVALAGLLAVVALAGPVWRELPHPVYRQQQALVVVLDLSRSMAATDVRPSRLVRARRKVRDLIQQRLDGQTALVVFAGDAFAVTPLTDDVNTIDALVPSLSTDLLPIPGTRTDRALDIAAGLLERAGVRAGRVLLMTDEATAPGLDEAVARLTRAGHRLSVIGVGTAEGGAIPTGNGDFVRDDSGQVVIHRVSDASLQALARAGKGRYARLSIDDRDLAQVLSGGDADWFSVEAVTGVESDRWREEGPWLLLLLLPVASLAFRRGLLGLAMLALVPFPEPVAAMEWQALWYTDDQRGALAFEAKDYAQAAAAFRDPEWQAAALYRAGDFEQAAILLAPLQHARARYNRANALARLGKVDEAMALYEQVLDVDPAHADARYNLEMLRDLQQRKKPRQGGGGERSEPRQQSPDSSDSASAGKGANDGEPTPREDDRQPQSDPGETSDTGEARSSDARSAGGENEPERMRADRDETAGTETEDQIRQPGEGTSTPSPEAAQQAMQQWLRRIKDDPGGLLRRKFEFQYSRRPPRADGADTPPW